MKVCITTDQCKDTSLLHKQVGKLVHPKLGQAVCIGNNVQYPKSPPRQSTGRTLKHQVLTSFGELYHSGTRYVA